MYSFVLWKFVGNCFVLDCPVICSRVTDIKDNLVPYGLAIYLKKCRLQLNSICYGRVETMLPSI